MIFFPFDFTLTVTFDVMAALVVSILILLISWWVYSGQNFYRPDNQSFVGFVKFGLVIYAASSIFGVIAVLIIKVFLTLIYGLLFGFDDIFKVVER